MSTWLSIQSCCLQTGHRVHGEFAGLSTMASFQICRAGQKNRQPMRWYNSSRRLTFDAEALTEGCTHSCGICNAHKEGDQCKHEHCSQAGLGFLTFCNTENHEYKRTSHHFCTLSSRGRKDVVTNTEQCLCGISVSRTGEGYMVHTG